MDKNKYIFDGKCYSPFHYLKDSFTCSCGLPIGDDMATKLYVREIIIRESRLSGAFVDGKAENPK